MAKSEVRIDKWLWAVRIFKTRTIATDACKKGRVSIGDALAKPSRMVKVGDVVKVRKPPVTYSFKVLALTENRLGAKLVPEYMDNITPRSEVFEGRELSRFTEQAYGDDLGWDFDFDDDFLSDDETEI